MISKTAEKHEGSFRDPSGFIFIHDGSLFRQVNQKYKSNYDLLLSSGLYNTLTKRNLLVGHQEVSVEPMDASQVYKVIAPEEIPFISYPFEWCFSQLKDAALITLDILLTALDAGMTLKDASSYNVQFRNGHPILIDTLSFEAYVDGQPWIGYRQFCQHFLAPLALMAYKDVRLSKLLALYVDGVPLDLASKLLPGYTWFDYRILTHIHLHSRWQAQANGTHNDAQRQQHLPLSSLKALIEDLRSAVLSLKLPNLHSTWVGYDKDNTYSEQTAEEKGRLVAEFIDACGAKRVLDLGANTGVYSRLAASMADVVVSADFDHHSVETNYKRCLEANESNVLPLVVDLNNPTAAFGFANSERMSFIERGQCDLVMALAIVHHLAIANNVPLVKVARFFAQLGKFLIIEFVPKEDSQVKRLLASREDIFVDYNQEGFEKAFSQYFAIERMSPITQSQRSLYLMRRADDK